MYPGPELCRLRQGSCCLGPGPAFLAQEDQEGLDQLVQDEAAPAATLQKPAEQLRCKPPLEGQAPDPTRHRDDGPANQDQTSRKQRPGSREPSREGDAKPPLFIRPQRDILPEKCCATKPYKQRKRKPLLRRPRP